VEKYKTVNDSNFATVVKRFQSADSDERRWAIFDMQDYAPHLIVPYLVTAIQDQNRAVREATSEVMSSIPAEVVLPSVVPLLGSSRIEVRNIVASLLVQFGRRAVPYLLDGLNHPNEDVRKFVADILGLTGDGQAVEDLCKTALEDGEPNVVAASIEALGKIRSPQALPALYKIFENSEIMKVEAAEAIGLIGEPESAEFLEKYLDTEDEIVKYAIIDALGNLGQASSVPALLKQISGAADLIQEQLSRAVLKIGQNSQSNVLNHHMDTLGPVVFKRLGSETDELSSLVGYQLSLPTDKNVIETFFDNKDYCPPNVLVALIKSASQTEDFIEQIGQLKNHFDDWVAYTALETLGNFSKEKVAPAILSVLAGEENLSTVAAIKTAANLQIDEAVPYLENLANSENEDISFAANQALAQIGTN
jgi:HEAT repeat protein